MTLVRRMVLEAEKQAANLLHNIILVGDALDRNDHAALMRRMAMTEVAMRHCAHEWGMAAEEIGRMDLSPVLAKSVEAAKK